MAPNTAGRPEVLTRQDGTTVMLVSDPAGRTAAGEYCDFGVAPTSPAMDADALPTSAARSSSRA